jgi:hypothetical protein
MNQYRCETCKFHYPPYGCESVVLESLERIPGEDAVCPWQIIEINEGKGWEGDSEPIEFEQLEAITALVGCASHSDFRSERDKMLEDIIGMFDNGNYNGVTVKQMIEGKFKEIELRKAGEP